MSPSVQLAVSSTLRPGGAAAVFMTVSAVLSALLLPGCAPSRETRDVGAVSVPAPEPAPAPAETPAFSTEDVAPSSSGGTVSPSTTPAERALALGTSAVGRVGSSMTGDRDLAALREARPEPPARTPLGSQVERLLSQAAAALAAGDPARGLDLAEEASRLSPNRTEPLEVMLLSHLATGSPDEVRATIRAIGAIDPASAVWRVFEGLEAARRGDDEQVCASLAWLVGRGAVERRGAAIPVPTRTGELEEQFALSALGLGYPSAALEALDVLLSAPRLDERVVFRASMLRADALPQLSRDEEARRVLAEIIARADGGGASADQVVDDVRVAMKALARLRLDSLAANDDGFPRELAGEFAALAPGADAGLLYLRLASLDDGTRGAVYAALDAIDAGSARVSPASPAEVVRRTSLRDADLADLAVLSSAPCATFADIREIIRSVARARGADSVIALARDAVGRDPDRLESVVTAVLASGLDLAAIMEAIDRADAGAPRDAVRSRVIAKFASPEEGFLVADAARSRDRASGPALAACVLAAAEFGDGVLVLEIDDEASSLKPSIAGSLAAAALQIDDTRRAFARAAQLDDGASAAQDLTRALAAVDAGLGGSASDSLLWRSFLRPRTRCGAQSDLVASLIRSAREPDGNSEPLAAEMIALAEELEPGAGVLEIMAGRVRPPQGRRGVDVDAWAVAVARDAPASPLRRQHAVTRLAGSDPLSAGRAVQALDGPGARTTELLARFDAAALADPMSRAREDSRRAGLRPRTPDALVAQAGGALRAGDFEGAIGAIEALAVKPSGVIPERTVRGALRLCSALAQEDSASDARLRTVLPQLLARTARCGLSEIEAVVSLAAVLDVSAQEATLIATMIGRTARFDVVAADGAIDPAKLERHRRECSAVFTRLVERDGDPFLLSQVAKALAYESRLLPELRAFHGSSAVALSAASGDGAEQTVSLMDSLAADGVALFAREGEPAPSVAESLFRASSAFSMVGDESGSEELLREVIRRDPALAVALNNLAFTRISAGEFDAEVVELAERAASLAPSDPSVLDTLGWARYHAGRFRDDAKGPGAITLLRQALRISPDDPSLETLDHLGDALWRAGDQEGALKCWQQVEQVAALRYPPEQMARNVIEFQRREFGVRLVDPVEYVKRQYLRVVARAEVKLEEVAKGNPPSVAECLGLR
jgi:tetratricopeptide (TPR) repeat protein